MEGPIDDEIEAIIDAIRAKPNWPHKVANPQIAKRYVMEAAQQGASTTAITAALRHLLYQAALEQGLDCTLQLPSDEWDYGGKARRTPADEVIFVDGLVPEELRMLLVAQLDAIANGPEKDFHPGSNGKVIFGPLHFSCA